MASPMELLPVELVDQIASILDREEVRTLRQISATINSKISVRLWNRRTYETTVALTRPSLELFVSATQNSRLICKLRTLVIALPIACDLSRSRTGHTPDLGSLLNRPLREAVALIDAQFELSAFQEEEKTRLLSQAFGNMRRNKGDLPTLLFKATSVGFDETRKRTTFTSRWLTEDADQEGTDEVFRVVSNSLARTGLKITSRFGLAKTKSNITIDELSFFVRMQKHIAESLCCLKTLKIGLFFKSIELGDKTESDRRRTIEIANAEVERYVPDLVTLLRCVPALEELRLFVSCAKNCFRDQSAIDIDAQVCRALVAAGPFPNLAKFTFNGFGWLQRDLSAFRRVAPQCKLVDRWTPEVVPVDLE